MKRQRTNGIMRMIRYLVLLALFLCISLPTHAQETTPEPETKWWWAWRAATHELLVPGATLQFGY